MQHIRVAVLSAVALINFSDIGGCEGLKLSLRPQPLLARVYNPLKQRNSNSKRGPRKDKLKLDGLQKFAIVVKFGSKVDSLSEEIDARARLYADLDRQNIAVSELEEEHKQLIHRWSTELQKLRDEVGLMSSHYRKGALKEIKALSHSIDSCTTYKNKLLGDKKEEESAHDANKPRAMNEPLSTREWTPEEMQRDFGSLDAYRMYLGNLVNNGEPSRFADEDEGDDFVFEDTLKEIRGAANKKAE